MRHLFRIRRVDRRRFRKCHEVDLRLTGRSLTGISPHATKGRGSSGTMIVCMHRSLLSQSTFDDSDFGTLPEENVLCWSHLNHQVDIGSKPVGRQEEMANEVSCSVGIR